jgi:2-polyprenyl-3-methyl-5-hydroxy-6-metoxy-1,4-benzoquinol methylase
MRRRDLHRARHDLFRESVGADIDAEQVRDCRAVGRCAQRAQFASIDDLRAPGHHNHYDAVVCMEVLEHCPSDVQPLVLDDLDRLVRPHGVVIISVPSDRASACRRSWCEPPPRRQV